MFLCSEVLIWVPFYAAILYAAIRRWKIESIWIILSLVLCIVLADQTSDFFKDWFMRPRPSREAVLQGLVHTVNGYTGGKYGFVSAHAANSFGFALLSSMIFRQKTFSYFVFTWAIIVSYTRIYLGVHYPMDIIGGMLIGFISALICYFLLTRIRSRLIVKKSNRYPFILSLSKNKVGIPICVLTLTFIAVIIYSLLV